MDNLNSTDSFGNLGPYRTNKDQALGSAIAKAAAIAASASQNAAEKNDGIEGEKKYERGYWTKLGKLQKQSGRQTHP